MGNETLGLAGFCTIHAYHLRQAFAEIDYVLVGNRDGSSCEHAFAAMLHSALPGQHMLRAMHCCSSQLELAAGKLTMRLSQLWLLKGRMLAGWWLI